MIDTIVPYITNPDGTIHSFLRGDGKVGSTDVSKKFDSISGHWVSVITSTFDQDVSALIVGAKGSGKSSAVLSIDYHCALKVADFVNDERKWSDFYNLEEFTAVILEEEATRLMNIQEKYVIKNFDDIGIGWGARNWRDQGNIDKNDIFQINRTDSAIQTFSVPNQFLLDKVPRSLVSHYLEMDQKLFQLGYSTVKLFKPRTMFRESKIINPYLQVDRNKFVNYLIPAPPHHLWMEYKKIRAANKDTAIRRRNEAKKKLAELQKMEEEVKQEKLLRSLGMSEKPVKKNSIDMKHEEWESWFTDHIPDITKMIIEESVPVDKAISLVIRKEGLTHNAIAYFRREKFANKFSLDKISRA